MNYEETIFFVLAVAILGSCMVPKKGKWTNSEKEKARKELSKVDAEIRETLGEQTDDFFDCYMEKIMSNYANFKEANEDFEGCENLALECAEAVLKL